MVAEVRFELTTQGYEPRVDAFSTILQFKLDAEVRFELTLL
jgi:hypothetical protein